MRNAGLGARQKGDEVDAVETGGEAKTLLESGLVRVNGNPEKRRGAQLNVGDVVTVAGKSWRVI